VSEAITDWILGQMVFGSLWLLSFLGQRVSKFKSDAVPVPKRLAWISGYPTARTVNPSNFGWQFFAVSMSIAWTVIVLVVPEHDARIAWFTLAFVVMMLVTPVIVVLLRRRRVNGR